MSNGLTSKIDLRVQFKLHPFFLHFSSISFLFTVIGSDVYLLISMIYLKLQ